jgi:hypothetical protein
MMVEMAQKIPPFHRVRASSSQPGPAASKAPRRVDCIWMSAGMLRKPQHAA